MRAKIHIKKSVQFVLTTLLAAILCLSGIPAEALAEILDGSDAVTDSFGDEQGLPTDSDDLSAENLGELLGESDEGDESPFLVEDAASGEEPALVLSEEPTIEESSETSEATRLAEDLAMASRKLTDSLRVEVGEDATSYQLIRAAYLHLATVSVSRGTDVEVTAGSDAASSESLDAEALAALRSNSSSPAGITRALRLVLDELGLPAVEVEAADLQARAADEPVRTWVMVRVGEQWYHVDAATTACDLTDARAADDDDAQPSLDWLLLSDEDLRVRDESRYPWTLAAASCAEGGQNELGDEVEPIEEQLPEAPETYVFDDSAEEQVPSEEPAAEELVTEEGPVAGEVEPGPEPGDEVSKPADDLSENLTETKPEDEPVLHPQYTYHFTLALDNAWHSMSLSLGDNPDAWSFTLAQAGTVTLYVKASDVDMHFSVHSGDSISTTQYGSQFNLLAEFHGNVEETNSLTLNLSKGTYYLIARDWASNSAGTYYVRGNLKSNGGNIANARVASVGARAYTGRPIKPTPKVTYGGTTLKLNTDYTLRYQNNTKIGTAKIIITGKGNYTGSKTISFAIKKNIAKLKFSKVKKRVTYTGKAIKPRVSVKKGKTVLKRNKHYTVTYKKNRNVGLASIVIKGKGAYAGSKTIHFRILPRSLAKGKVTGFKKKCTYTGHALKPKPKVRVKIGKRMPTLKLGRDYTLSYAKNIVPGTAKIIIKGKGNFKGKRVVKFKVVRGSHYYLLKRDTWNFYNFDEAIPLSYYTRIFGSSKGKLLRSRDDGSGGTCYGMSTTIGAIARYGVPRVTSYSSYSGKAYSIYQVSEYSRSTANGLTAHQFIQAAQIMQYDVRMQRELSNNRNNVNSLVRAARASIKGGTPMVISFWWRSGGNSYGHAVVPLRIKSNSSTRAVITVYDCNTPGVPQTLTLNKRGGYLTSMSYTKDYGSFYGCTWSTPSNEVRGLMQGRGVYRSGASANATLVSVTSDARLVADGGESFTLSSSAENDPDKVLHVLRVGGFADAGELYWVNLGSDRMGFTDITEDSTVSVATETGGIDVDVSAGSDVVLDTTPDAQNTVVVDTGSSPDFQMTFTDAVAAGEVRVSGTAEGIVVGKQDGNVITLSGADVITVTNGDQSTGEVALDPSKIYQIDLAGHAGEPDVSEDSSAATEDEVELMVQMIGDLTGGEN